MEVWVLTAMRFLMRSAKTQYYDCALWNTYRNTVILRLASK